MFVLRSTCFQALYHVFAQIYMPMCSFPCLCLDLCFFRPCVMPMLRSLRFCALCHVCVIRSICWLLCHVLLQPFFSLDISLSCVLALIGRVQIQILWSRPTSTHLTLYQRVWIISLYAYVCLLLCFMSMFASLDQGLAMLCAPRGFVLVWLNPFPLWHIGV